MVACIPLEISPETKVEKADESTRIARQLGRFGSGDDALLLALLSDRRRDEMRDMALLSANANNQNSQSGSGSGIMNLATLALLGLALISKLPTGG